ncbi:cupin domain-containing protein [Arcticibacter sp.]|uniref:cupin domain-containing protein n=1 Tax=Arcticibacter sp. TaxID=1872630 RepID=UPI003890DC70
MKISLHNAEHYKWGTNCDGWHLLKSSSLSVIQERMPEGSMEIAHFHSKSQQLFYVLSGAAAIQVGDETTILTSGECIHVPCGATHSIANKGTQTLEFLVISEPMAHGDRSNIELKPDESDTE